MIAKSMDVKRLSSGAMLVELIFPDSSAGTHLQMLATNCDKIDVTIEKYFPNRSATANSTLWRYCQLIAEVLRTTKEEVYIKMLKDYGQHAYVVVQDKDLYTSKLFRHVEILGHVVVNGTKTGTQILGYFGTSNTDVYNSRNFSILLDGVLHEAKELGIPGLEENEFERIIQQIGE